MLTKFQKKANKQKQRIPNKQTRRALSPKPGSDAERFAELANAIAARAYEKILKRHADEWIRRSAGSRVDAVLVDNITREFAEAVDLEFAAEFPLTAWDRQMGKAEAALERKSQADLAAFVGLTPDVATTALYHQGRQAALYRIHALTQAQTESVGRALYNVRGASVEEMTAKVANVLSGEGYAGPMNIVSKAKLLARDQTLKTHAAVTKHRHEDAGATGYIWTTSRDDRVRDAHADLEGTRQTWANPPVASDSGVQYHPGEDYQCRCTAYPIFPDIK